MEDIMDLLKLNSKIYRSTQSYLEKTLRAYELSGGLIPYLFILEHNEGISQIKLSKEVENDKAMSARSIAKLIALGYVTKEADTADSRAYKLFLTQKARAVLPELHEKIQELIKVISSDLSENDQAVTIQSMRRILEKTRSLKEEEQ